jgi:hypothetical protein
LTSEHPSSPSPPPRDQLDKRASFLNRIGLKPPNEASPLEVDRYLRFRKVLPCPECTGEEVVLEDGCSTCVECGYSEVLYVTEEVDRPSIAPGLLLDESD